MAGASRGREVGKTRDAGWQVGARRTLPVSVADAWRLVTSPEGVRAWLGDGARVTFERGREYALADGAAGTVRVVQPESHVRLTWHPDGWPRPSTIQVRVIPAGERTTIAFHQEHMPNAAAREERRAHFAAVLDTLERVVAERAE
ncbi:MAG TPA: SRPBCC domain-containing protein [Longimicrobium sp.]|nr:SRPBCC domain-containing protein [Longimicrobium sp.]